jgi:hypothetical protein
MYIVIHLCKPVEKQDDYIPFNTKDTPHLSTRGSPQISTSFFSKLVLVLLLKKYNFSASLDL